jgi:hypothetical protein
MQIESPPLNAEHTDHDVDANLDADRVHWRSGTSRRAPSFESDQVPSDRPSNSRRIKRSLARFSLAALIHACLAVLRWRDGQSLGSIARLVITHLPARPGCNFYRITAAA